MYRAPAFSARILMEKMGLDDFVRGPLIFKKAYHGCQDEMFRTLQPRHFPGPSSQVVKAGTGDLKTPLFSGKRTCVSFELKSSGASSVLPDILTAHQQNDLYEVPDLICAPYTMKLGKKQK